MKQSKFTDEQIIGFRKQADAGMSVKEPHAKNAAGTTLVQYSSRPQLVQVR
jgi:hypothetical protein